MTDCFVALGSNLGDSSAILLRAFDALAKIQQSVLIQTSSLYRTAPLGCSVSQNDFVNAVAQLKTPLSAMDFLKELWAIEQQFGRVRSFVNAPRTLDLDLLLFGNQVIHLPKLIVPHPRMHLRAFVLVPLCEINALQMIPTRGQAKAWRAAVSLQKIFRL